MHDGTPVGGIEAELIRRGDPGYEDARSEAVWNGRTPQRFPDAIVRAGSTDEVARAVTYARAHGLRVAIRSGGHNWSGAPLRDGGLLIDLSRMARCDVDPATARATVGPATTGRDLLAALAPHDLAFPVGHCPSVAMGGFLLSGGLGWNSRSWGPACADIEEIEAVTADGRTVVCDATRHPDLFWAARGAGPGFFAVVTRFRLALHPRPAVIMTCALTFPLTEVRRVTAWAARIAEQLPPNVETTLVLTPPGPPDSEDPPGPRLTVGATVFAATQAQALDALAPVVGCPFAGRALSRQVPVRTSFAALLEDAGSSWPQSHRYAADTLWSAESYETQLTRIADQVARAPSGKSLVLAPVVPVSQDPALLRNMAFAPLGASYLVCYAIWDDPAADAVHTRWLRDAMATLDPGNDGGHYIAETDLEADTERARRSYRPADRDRLQELKARWDPHHVFHSYLAP